MAPGKDMRRPDLSDSMPIVTYQEPAPSGERTDFSATLASTMLMAAIFTRNKFIGWAAVVFSTQSWLGESDEARKTSNTPDYFSVLMSLMALLVTYMPLFFPPKTALTGSVTEDPAPKPLG